MSRWVSWVSSNENGNEQGKMRNRVNHAVHTVSLEPRLKSRGSEYSSRDEIAVVVKREIHSADSDARTFGIERSRNRVSIAPADGKARARCDYERGQGRVQICRIN